MDIARPPVSRVAPAADGTPGGRGGSERGFAEAAVRDGAESWLRLAGLHCAACAITIEEALRGVEGVQQVEVNAASARARVSWDPARTRPSALVDAVRAAGYEALPDTAAAARAQRRAEHRQMLWRLFVAGFCAMQVMMLATPAYVAGPQGLEPDLRRLLDLGSWMMSIPVLVFSAAPFLAGAWRALRTRRIGMDVPVALGIAVAFAASSAAAFDPSGPLGSAVYFDSLTMFVALLLVARLLEQRVRHRAAATLEGALDALPETAERLREDGAVESVDPSRLRPGDRVRVPAGGAFAADGVLLEGTTSVDESLLSGEARPQTRRPGDAVVAGANNLEAPVVMRVERAGADTRYEAIVALMRRAQSARPASARWADRWAAPFLWTVLLLAAAAAAAWTMIEPARAAGVAVAVLVVSCPCALSLATPSALLAATDALAARGLLLARPEALEALARCTRAFVDKTGTLTEGRLRLVEARRLGASAPCDLVAQEEATRALLERAASLAAWSRHPVAQALREAVVPARPVRWQDSREVPGAGLEAHDEDGRAWRLGSAEWVGVDAAAAAEPAGCGAIAWFGPAGQGALRLCFEDALRPDAVEAAAALRDDGLPLRLLSGDAPERVARVAGALGLEVARGGATPADKLAAVCAEQQAGHTVLMLGDGINDAPVLAQADVSVAMGAGAAIARAQADAVLLSGRLGELVAARRLARRCLRVIRQNIAWAALYNLACVPLAVVGWMPPWAAGLGMAASSLVVVGNALRLRRV